MHPIMSMTSDRVQSLHTAVHGALRGLPCTPDTTASCACSAAGLHPRAANQWLQGCKWAAITCVVVTAPVLGKVAQVSLERTLGTVSGVLPG